MSATMRTDCFVYISGPMAAGYDRSVEENVTTGLLTYLDCLKRGIPAFCPHLSGAFPSAWADVSWETWLEYDYQVIARCTHMLMLPNWQTSRGACRERIKAEQIGIPVVYSIKELEKHLP